MARITYRERYQLQSYPLQEGVRVEAYWRDDEAGVGPAASVYVDDEEILRLDCFGGSLGHCHVNLLQAMDRYACQHVWFYPPATARQHVEWAMHDLVVNLPMCLRHNDDSAIRETSLDEAAIREIEPRVRAYLLELIQRMGKEDGGKGK